jgi:hypothetical protein
MYANGIYMSVQVKGAQQGSQPHQGTFLANQANTVRVCHLLVHAPKMHTASHHVPPAGLSVPALSSHHCIPVAWLHAADFAVDAIDTLTHAEHTHT